ncbi:hypothetical protein [Paracoccus tegillarcae]|uniref:hypothetical protein n=1 Tax=Paracoccus tegillarcae TaxID=1529068 RepID=UPI001E644FD3|nr:hypothetical protein [Paracoccus tegillarcae]
MVGVLPVGSLPDDPQPIATIFWSMAVDRMAGWAGSSIEDWKAEAVSIWPEISPFLRGITRNDQLITVRYTHGSLSRPYSQSMVHIGDAAHRASP